MAAGVHYNFCVSQMEYSYRVKICKKDSPWRTLHHFHEKFRSPTEIKAQLMDEFCDDVPASTRFSVGYFEGKQSKKLALVNRDDLRAMYSSSHGGEIQLWCDAPDTSSSDKKENKKSCMEEKDASANEIFHELQEKHGNKYPNPALRLWSRMIASGVHESKDDPPAVPMISGNTSKRKGRESFTDAFVGACSAVVEAIKPPTTSTQATQNTPPPKRVCTSADRGTVLSPGRTVELRTKYMEQLSALKKVYEDGVLTQDEFMEQKKIILGNLRTLQ